MKKLKGDVIKIANSLNKRISESDVIFNTNDWNKQRELVTNIVIEVTNLDEIDDNDEICLLVNALCEKYNIGISKDDSDLIDSEETINNEKLEDIVFAEYQSGCVSLNKMLKILSNTYDINLNATVILEDGEELGIVKDVVKDYMFIAKDSISKKPFVSDEDKDDLICSDNEYDSLIEFIEKYAEENDIELHECSGNEFRDIINLACENLNIDINSRLEGSIDSIFEKLVEDYDIVIDDEDDFPEMKSYELHEWIESHDEITPEVLNEALNTFEKLSEFDYDPSEYRRRMYDLAEYYEIDENTIEDYLE